MDIYQLASKGYSHRAIARTLGIHRATVKKYLAHPDQVGTYHQQHPRPSLLDPYVSTIEGWLHDDPYYTATWIYDRLRAMGFPGSYEIVKRKVRALKDDLQRLAYIRFETEPAEQAQVDFGHFQVTEPTGTVTDYYLFAMILGYSRQGYAELIDHCDLPTFLECHLRAFTWFGGVPHTILYDRMKNVFIRRLLGTTYWNSSLIGLATHYGFRPEVTPAYAPWVKGKVERPMAFIREGFWRGYGFTDLATANRDLQTWLTQKAERIHGTTGERVSVRFQREQPLLGAVPAVPFDTAARLYRTVHKDCTIYVQGNRYVVPHRLVGQQVVVRCTDHELRVFADDQCLVTYPMADGTGQLIQDPRFYAALRQDRHLNARKYGRGRRHKGRAHTTISPTLGDYAITVEARALATYDAAAEGRS